MFKQLKYLKKSNLVQNRIGYGQQIIIIQPPAMTLVDGLIAIDDRDIISRLQFTHQIRIEILKELLTFQNDTVKSNKLLYIRGRWKNVEDKAFTIEIEALYSFTRMLTEGNPRILPVLINRKTQEVITNKRKEIDEVYDLYRKWLLENEKTGFKGFSFPLANSPYDWLGSEDLNKYLKESL